MNPFYYLTCLASRIPIACAVCVAVVITGCARLPDAPSLDRQERAWLLSGEALLGKEAAATLELPDRDLLALSEEMRHFLQLYVPDQGSRARRIEALIYALRHPGLLGFNYVGAKTYTAEEAFFFRNGNCLTFTALLVAMGRELGFKVQFNEVDVPPSWGIQGEQTFVLYKHINAIVQRGHGDRAVVDVTPDVYEVEYPQRVIADHLAEAQYYNNLGADFMAENDHYQAFRHFKKALQLAPEQTYLWSNLGTLYRRYDLNSEAEAAFLYALALDADNIAAISSLERLYLHKGMEEQALAYRRRAEQARNKNPYFRYLKAEEAYREGQYQLALAHSTAAIEAYGGDHRFHFLQGASYMQLGQQQKSEAAFARAYELAGEEPDRDLYQAKLQQLQAQR